MKERPILFSAPMVRAILAGTKTQTRRVLAPRGLGFIDCCCGGTAARWVSEGDRWHCGVCGGGARLTAKDVEYLRCPYGQPSDGLWVRETWMDLQGAGIEHRPDPAGPRQRYAFRSDSPPGSYGDEARKDYGLKWRPSIHMPRAASRILLEVTAVRVERLQEISETDVRAEGVTPDEVRQFWLFGADEVRRAKVYRDAAVRPFRSLWEQINGPDSWELNPWVWVVEFRRITPP